MIVGRGEAESSPERDSSEGVRTGPGGPKTNQKSGHILKNVLFSLCKETIRDPKLSKRSKSDLAEAGEDDPLAYCREGPG